MEIANIKTTEYPVINDDNTCAVNDAITVVNCAIDDKGNITGKAIVKGTDETITTRFDNNKSIWLFGAKNIKKNNLVSLSDRTKDERMAIIEKSRESYRENRDKKKNFNELAKAMLEQTVSEEQIKAVLGDNTSVLLDNSVASVILASMIKGAVEGSFKCAEFVRDTAGYRPKDIMQVEADIMTDSDRALIDKLNQRIG